MGSIVGHSSFGKTPNYLGDISTAMSRSTFTYTYIDIYLHISISVHIYLYYHVYIYIYLSISKVAYEAASQAGCLLVS